MAQEPEETDAIALPIGIELGNYVIQKVIGQGGFGITYLAHDNSLDVDVVIKENMPSMFAFRDTTTLVVRSRTISSEESDAEWARQRFLQEARTLAKLNHRNIVRVLYVFCALNTAYYVMPFINGSSLDRKLEADGPMDEATLRPMLLKILEALRYLHSRNLLHRDLKPGNILLEEHGEPVLIDFGTARALTQYSQTVVESPGYTPIEQMQTHGKVGPWSDLYALGATMYKLITGDAPARSTDRIGEEDSFVPLTGRSDLKGGCSDSFLRSIDRAMGLWPGKRWQSAEEWMEALNAMPIAATPSSEEPRKPATEEKAALRPTAEPKRKAALGAWRGRRIPLISGSAVALALLGGALWGGGWLTSEPKSAVEPEPHAEQVQAEAAASELAQLRADAERGYAEAQLRLAERLEQEGKTEEAFSWLEKAAAKGQVRAMYRMGEAYRIGRGVEADDKRAEEWLSKAAEEGDADAAAAYAEYFLRDNSDAFDPKKAVEWLTRAADGGSAAAMCRLGTCYRRGLGVRRDGEKALALFRRAAEAGSARGVAEMGRCYAEGIGVERDLAKGCELYRQASEQGDAVGMERLAECCLSGQGVTRNEPEGVRLLQRAAEAGDAAATSELAALYADGEAGLPRDEAKAESMLRRAVETGAPEALCALGRFLLNPRCGRGREEEGLALLHRAANLCYEPAWIVLGTLYHDGVAVGQDQLKAMMYFQMGAAAGDARAMVRLGRCFDEGSGTARNAERARKLYQRAAELGCAEAEPYLKAEN